MKITFLGTGNAAGIPSPFCHCRVCSKARESLDNNLRTRSSLLINDNILIDVSPDFFHQCLKQKIDASLIHSVFITHTHSDHFQITELFHSMLAKSNSIYINVFMSSSAFQFMKLEKEHLLRNSYMKFAQNQITFQEVRVFEKYFFNDVTIIPIPSTHVVNDTEIGLNYVVFDKSHTILYGTDTKGYHKETIQYLRKFTFDLIILDANDGFCQKSESNHNNINDVSAIINELNLCPNCRVMLTHISHETNLIHNELQESINKFFGKYVSIAYDGYIEKLL